MSKTRKASTVVVSDSPELILGKVLFARQEAEKIVAMLNEISTYVISNNTTLESDEAIVALDNLKVVLDSLGQKIEAL